MAAFDACLAVILGHEKGYVDNPHDNGGATNLGVTKATWEDWIGRPCTKAEIKALTRAKVTPLYRARYWNPIRGDDLPPALGLCVFDFAVNAGPGRSARYLQKLVGASVDGKVGPATLAAVRAEIARDGLAEVVRGFQQMRRTYYRQLDDFPHFGRGWLRRVDAVETAALRLVP